MLVNLATPTDPTYAEAADFARRVYLTALGAAIEPAPDAFAYTREDGSVCGCLGLYCAAAQGRLQIESYFPSAFESIAGKKIGRTHCGELGTRAVEAPPGYRSADISLALTASLLIYAQARGLQYLGFTSNRASRSLIRALGLKLIELGTPDLSLESEAFRRNWERFFRVRQTCFGLRLDSLDECRRAVRRLAADGFRAGDSLAGHL